MKNYNTLFHSIAYRFIVCCLAVILMLGPALQSAQASAGQHITIDNDVNDVAGNGDPPNYHYPSPMRGTATGNTMTIGSVTVTGTVFGGAAGGTGYPNDATATGNIVTINGATVKNYLLGIDVYGSTVHGGFAQSIATATATDNTVTLNNATVTNTASGTDSITVSGGYASGISSAIATGNTVTVNGNSIDATINGGYAVGENDSAIATGNSVTINSGTLEGLGENVYGGNATSKETNNAAAMHNSVTISGGVLKNMGVYGGNATSKDGSGTTATHNTVTISGTPQFVEVDLYGGLTGIPGTGGTGIGDAFTGNTLEFKSSGLTVTSLNNFEYINFYLPSGLLAGGAMLTVNTTFNLDNVKVDITDSEADLILELGDVITLINDVSVTGTFTVKEAKGGRYLFDISVETIGSEDALIAEVIGIGPSAPQNFTANPGDGQVSLSWSEPLSEGDSAIIRYEVSQDNGARWVTASSDTGHTFTGLTNGTSYTFKVRAVNSTTSGTEVSVTAAPVEDEPVEDELDEDEPVEDELDDHYPTGDGGYSPAFSQGSLLIVLTAVAAAFIPATGIAYYISQRRTAHNKHEK